MLFHLWSPSYTSTALLASCRSLPKRPRCRNIPGFPSPVGTPSPLHLSHALLFFKTGLTSNRTHSHTSALLSSSVRLRVTEAAFERNQMYNVKRGGRRKVQIAMPGCVSSRSVLKEYQLEAGRCPANPHTVGTWGVTVWPAPPDSLSALKGCDCPPQALPVLFSHRSAAHML